MEEDHILMQDGRVMITRGGETTRLDDEITMPDGTRVSTDGTVRMPDGTMRMMAEGETMLLHGETASEEMTDRQFREAMEDEELRDDIE